MKWEYDKVEKNRMGKRFEKDDKESASLMPAVLHEDDGNFGYGSSLESHTRVSTTDNAYLADDEKEKTKNTPAVLHIDCPVEVDRRRRDSGWEFSKYFISPEDMKIDDLYAIDLEPMPQNEIGSTSTPDDFVFDASTMPLVQKPSRPTCWGRLSLPAHFAQSVWQSFNSERGLFFQVSIWAMSSCEHNGDT